MSIYDKKDDFNFGIVNNPHGDVDTYYGVYSSQPIRLARVSNIVEDLCIVTVFITDKILQQGYHFQNFLS